MRVHRITGLTIITTLTALAVATTTASAASDSLHVAGPTSNMMGTNFNETIAGYATGAANYVVAWEQFYKHSGCATTFAQESTRAFFTGTYGLTAWLAQPVSGQYSTVARFGAKNPGTHGMCAYLINLSTGVTYANDSIWWNNHN